MEEDHGAITATLRPGSYIIGAESEAVVRVSDDEITATVFLGVAGVTSLPEGGRMPLLIVLSKALDGDHTVTLATALGGTATVGVVLRQGGSFSVILGSQDYRLVCETSTLSTYSFDTSGNVSITFDGAELNKQSVTNKRRVNSLLWLEAFEDNRAEENETITLSLGGGSVTRLAIKDAPSSVTLFFSQGNYSTRENSLRLQPVLLVDTAPGQDIVVPLVFTDITATGGEDYVAEDTMTFVTNGSTNNGFDIDVLDDTVYEGDETFRVEINASRLPDWVRVGSRSSVVFEIQENDARVEAQLPQVSLDSGAYRVTEGGEVSITVSIDVERPTSTTVPINYRGVTAVGSHSQYDNNRKLRYGQDYEPAPLRW